ncbi:MAG: YfhO family protein [Armatimonadota bacterium]
MAAIAVLVLVITGVFSRTLFMGQVLYRDDVRTIEFPGFAMLAGEHRAGHWLPWITNVGCGVPSLMIGGAFYPPNLLALLSTPLTWTFAFLCMAHYLWAAVGMFVLARRLGIRHTGAVSAGVVFSLTGFLTAHQNHYSLVSGASWLPWLAVGTSLWMRTRSPWGFLLAALSLTAAWLNHPQPFIYMVVFALTCIWLELPLIRTASRLSTGKLLSGLLRTTLPMVVGTMLAGFAVWPTLQQSHAGYGAVRQGYAFMTSYSLPPMQLITFILPNFFGDPWHYWGISGINSWEICGYAGGITLLSIIAIGGRVPGTRRLYCGLAVLATLSLLLAFGGYTPLYHALQYVPILNRFRCPGRWLLAWSGAMALLIGLVIHELSERLRSPLTARRLALLFGSVAGCAGIPGACICLNEQLTRSIVGAVQRAVQHCQFYAFFIEKRLSVVSYYDLRVIGRDLSWLAACAAVVGFALWFGGRNWLTYSWTRRIFASVVIAQALFFAWQYSPPGSADALQLPNRLASLLPHRVTEGRLIQGYRQGVPDDLRLLQPNTNLLFGVPLAEVYDPLKPPVVSLISKLGERHFRDPTVAAAFGGSTILTDLDPGNYPPSMSAAKRVPCDQGHRTAFLYQNPEYRGLAWTVSRTTSAATAMRSIANPNASAAFMRDAPWISPEPTWSRWRTRDATLRRVDVVEWSSERIRVNVEAGHPCSVVISSASLPGWTATVNGKPVPLAVANGVFQAVELPSDTCQVDLRYSPIGLRTGLLISMCGLLLGVLTLLASRSRRRTS